MHMKPLDCCRLAAYAVACSVLSFSTALLADDVSTPGFGGPDAVENRIADDAKPISALVKKRLTDPWFEWKQRKSRDMNILFGHWSTLGAYDAPGIHALDTGCLWGGKLTAFRLGRKKTRRIEYNCRGVRKPGKK